MLRPRRAANSGPRDAMARTRSRSLAVYALLLQLYAPEFLSRHRAEMLQNFEDLEHASSSKAALWLLVGRDLMLSIISRNIRKSIWGHAVPAFVVLAVVFGIWRAFAYDLAPVNEPEALGFSSSRLARIAAWQQAQVDTGAFSGAVAAISRNGMVTVPTCWDGSSRLPQVSRSISFSTTACSSRWTWSTPVFGCRRRSLPA